ncbi:MAG: hypothetical protein WAK82_38705 [Streptosporangiaceae bacterium]
MTCPTAVRGARSAAPLLLFVLLAGAYQQFYTSGGKSADAKEAVAVATKKLNSICPGAAS